jgi:6-phosphogluconate dehydrogenase
MTIGLIGLGKMGFNLALNLRNHGHSVIAHDLQPETLQAAAREPGIQTAESPEQLCSLLPTRRVIWMMVPAGAPVDALIARLLPQLTPDDILIDGGNSNYKDSRRRSTELLAQGIHLLDCGTSGGTSGALNGACTMIGGDPAAFEHCEAVFRDISLEGGCLYCGASGSGHFVKMVHNGIEYGMMQAMAEGFEVLEHSDYNLDFEQVAKLWNTGSVIRGWLMELAGNAFSKDARLDGIRGVMHASGEGKWTLETALEFGVPTPVIALSLMMRQRSQQEDTFSGKLVAALRNEFGGHAVEPNPHTSPNGAQSTT